MSFFSDIMLSGVERRREAIAEARAAGRLGATRLPLAVAADADLSDTVIAKCLTALDEGRQEREASRQEDAA